MLNAVSVFATCSLQRIMNYVGLVTYMKSAVCHITDVTVGFSKLCTLEFQTIFGN